MPAENQTPDQEHRDRLSTAIQAGDTETVADLLEREPSLSNADLRSDDQRDQFSNGYPLVRAVQRQNDQITELLLQHGADPDAPSSNPDDPPEHGMPLHYSVHNRDYRTANKLLDYGASPNGYPYCDQATIERIFYQAREAGVSDFIVRRAYARFLSNHDELESKTVAELVGTDAAEPILLFARMVDLGGQPPLCALVRDGFDELVMEILEHSQREDGTQHDHPNSTVFDNILGASRWYGYPQLVRRLMQQSSERFDYETAITTVGAAIGSHNRDGGYSQYREIIEMQLHHLKSRGELEEAQSDPEFKPIYQMATDFTWHNNYGFRAEIAKPECYIDLAELFVSWGFDDINYRDPKTGHSPLSAAVERGHHPGIGIYILWLLDQGADLRESDPDEVNPRAIAAAKGFEEIGQLLDSRTN